MDTESEAEETAVEKEAYLKTSARYHPFIKGINDRVNTPCIPTGFPRFDNYLGGGLYEGLYVIVAVSSMGKTSLVLQITDQIAEQGQDIIYFSLEMARYELMAKSISRLTFEACIDKRLANTTRGITDIKRYETYSPEVKDLIVLAESKYNKFADKIYIHEGIGELGLNEVRASIDKHILLTGKVPIVVIDYLQLLNPYNLMASDKQNSIKAVMELKRISRDSKTLIIVISSLTSMSCIDPVTMEAFKETEAIEYSADVLLGMQLKGIADKKKNTDFDMYKAIEKTPREIEIKILKNRNGKTGGKIDFKYYQLYNCFVEEKEEVIPVLQEKTFINHQKNPWSFK
jgi:replicative DNA helicase